MNIPWEKFLLSAVVGFVGFSLFSKSRFAGQAQFFGFSGPNIQLSPDVKTTTCTPANYFGNGAPAMYCNPECATGVDCADARAQYCRRYGIGGVCRDDFGGIIGNVEGNQGLPGTGPIVGGSALDIVNAYGWGALNQSPYGYGYGYPQQSYGYGYPQQPYYGYGYPQYGYGYPQQPYYGYQQPYYGYNYNYYRYPTRRAYAVTGYDKRSGHFLYG